MKTTNSNPGKSDHPSVTRMAASAHEAVDKMADVTNNTFDSFNEQGHRINEVQERWLAGVRQYVQDHPVSSIGMALAGGYLVSRIFSKR